MESTVTTKAPAVTIAGYSHVAVMVDDLDAAIAFYCDTLGFEKLPRPDFGPGTEGAWLQLGTAQVHLGTVAEMGPQAGFPHIALHVPAGAWEATVDELAARGVPFVMGPNTREDFGRQVRAAFIQDPAGNFIELTDVDPT
jgi:catechol 2,3-dioxygenase-like lactoylglutathione lyase family enzyme